LNIAGARVCYLTSRRYDNKRRSPYTRGRASIRCTVGGETARSQAIVTDTKGRAKVGQVETSARYFSAAKTVRYLAALMTRNWTHWLALNLMRRRTIIIAADCA